jgi:hypothetical protein
MVTSRIALTNAAAKRASKLGKVFERNLRDVAISVAEHDQVEVASPKHVELAFGVLASVGLTSVPWYNRPELKMGLGGFFLGISGCVGDIFTGLSDFQVLAWLKQFSGSAILICIIVGVFLSIWGWVSRRMIPSGSTGGVFASLRCWPWAACEHRSNGQPQPDHCVVGEANVHNDTAAQ